MLFSFRYGKERFIRVVLPANIRICVILGNIEALSELQTFVIRPIVLTPVLAFVPGRGDAASKLAWIEFIAFGVYYAYRCELFVYLGLVDSLGYQVFELFKKHAFLVAEFDVVCFFWQVENLVESDIFSVSDTICDVG